jgi:hypothetical protein
MPETKLKNRTDSVNPIKNNKNYDKVNKIFSLKEILPAECNYLYSQIKITPHFKCFDQGKQELCLFNAISSLYLNWIKKHTNDLDSNFNESSPELPSRIYMQIAYNLMSNGFNPMNIDKTNLILDTDNNSSFIYSKDNSGWPSVALIPLIIGIPSEEVWKYCKPYVAETYALYKPSPNNPLLNYDKFSSIT